MKFLFIFFFLSLFGKEIDLSQYEKSLYSQNGEDGIISQLFQLILPETKSCVELAAYDGIPKSNTHLLRLQGWNCLQIDRQYQIPKENIYKEFITAETVNEIFQKYHVPEKFDLLSIDMGYNDFHIWNSLDLKYNPSVVIIQYNSTHLPDEDKIVKYRPYYLGDSTDYYGASILALYNLGRSKGYNLVYAENSGNHLFFVREDLFLQNEIKFKNLNEVDKLYRPPLCKRSHDLRSRQYITSKEIFR
jgi:hypothetical protein